MLVIPTSQSRSQAADVNPHILFQQWLMTTVNDADDNPIVPEDFETIKAVFTAGIASSLRTLVAEITLNSSPGQHPKYTRLEDLSHQVPHSKILNT